MFQASSKTEATIP